MAPPAADVDIADSVRVKKTGESQSASRLSGPLTYSGSLDSYEHFDVTAVLGREFPQLQVSEILHDDTKIRDLAILGMVQPMRHPCPQADDPAQRLCAKLTPNSSVSAWRRLLSQPGHRH